jgi:hypothetical protein
MNKQQPQINVIWELHNSPDAEERLLAAFEMLFKDVAIDPPQTEPI